MKLTSIFTVILTAILPLSFAAPITPDVGFLAKSRLLGRADIDTQFQAIGDAVATWAVKQDQGGEGDYRSLFTSEMAKRVLAQEPGWNVMVSINDNKWNLNLPTAGNFFETIATTCCNQATFKIWYFAQGQSGNYFERTGDGGFINWDWAGCWTRTGNLVSFC